MEGLQGEEKVHPPCDVLHQLTDVLSAVVLSSDVQFDLHCLLIHADDVGIQALIDPLSAHNGVLHTVRLLEEEERTRPERLTERTQRWSAAPSDDRWRPSSASLANDRRRCQEMTRRHRSG